MTVPVAVVGAGAFGTALAIVMAAAGRPTLLWARDAAQVATMEVARENAARLPGLPLPDTLVVTNDAGRIGAEAIVLLAVPTQALRATVQAHADDLRDHMLVACCKGVERGTGRLPLEVIDDVLPGSRTGVLTGPSFARDIAAGKPTALTFATRDRDGPALQALLSTPALRLYLSDDPVGAQLGGALKNVVAIAAGITIGAGLGESARSALMTRGFAEIVRYAAARGARQDTLFGLSGFGDLVLTCTSTQSRNLSHGLAVGAGRPPDPSLTVEGVMTAHALAEDTRGGDLPITRMVSAVLNRESTLAEAVEALLARPLRRESGPA